MKNTTVLKIIGLFLFCSLIVFLIYWFLIKRSETNSTDNKRKNDCSLFKTDNPSVSLDSNPRKFFSISSTEGYLGRNKSGDLVDGNGTVIESGLKTAQDLGKYLLTYPLGHPYYKKGSFGYLNCYDWSNQMERYTQLSSIGLDLKNASDKVLIIENNDSKQYPIVIDIDLNVKGIVVRHGGILLVAGKDINIRTEFMLVESGGLFQAGSTWYPGYRFKNRLTITLTNPTSGYKFMGVVASQYSYQVYFPGVTIFPDKTTNDFTDHMGDTMVFSNTFGAKSIAAGFNGSYHFAGEISVPKPYYGTWSVFDNNTNEQIVDESRLLTYFDPTNDDAKKTAKLVNIATEYPNTWIRLKNGKYNQGSSIIYIDPRDASSDYLSNWLPGSKIVITAKTDTYTSTKDIIGMVPIWLDHDDTPNQQANQQANDKYMSGKTSGVEVATIKSIDGTGKIILQSPLKFNHDSRQVVLDNGKKQIRIDTNLHVGLLTRNILITSERNKTAEQTPGCNIWHTNLRSNPVDEFKGPGGSIYCNYKGASNGQVTNCYTNRTTDEAWFCGNNPANEKYIQTPTGHWILGTSGQTGCNAIQGGSTMFRYGSSVCIDSVEMKYMGQPANFGTIARYAIHFHLMGWVKTFRGYLPKDNDDSDLDFRREGIVANSSLWCVPTRWLVLHGTSEATIRNNVGFICYGSGYFVEDGTEMHNTFDHNAAICCLPSRINEYWNPLPIYSNTASDLTVPSCYWYKNNQTVSIRNLGCCSPMSVIHTWSVAQNISGLRGPSSVCIGSEVLGLPAIGTQDNAVNNLNQNNRGNKNPVINKYSTNTLCWMPDYFIEKTYADNELCVALTKQNCNNPIMANAENIAYCITGGYSEYPEGTGDEPPASYTGEGAGLGANNSLIMEASNNDPKPHFLPANAENTCTDSFAQCSYPEHMWGGEYAPKNPLYRFQPIKYDDILAIKKDTNKVVAIDFDTVLTPKIFSNWLTFNLGPNGGGLYGGAGWSKGSPTFLIGCCLLKNGGGTSYPQVPDVMAGDTTDNIYSSSLWATTTGDSDHNTYSNSYAVIYDMISNGGVGMLSTPTWVGGDKTFFDKSAYAFPMEYTFNDNQSPTYYFSDIDPLNDIPKFFWSKMLGNSNNIVQIYDIDKSTRTLLNKDGSPGQTKTNIQFSNTTKYPYLCKDQDLFKLSQIPADQTHFAENNPEWLGITINAQIKNFLSNYAINSFGKKLCTNLSKIIPCEIPPNNPPKKLMHCFSNNNQFKT